jgi:hypothetical protein
MGALESIVNVTITRQTTAVTKAGFGVGLLISEFLIADTTPTFDERIRFYSEASEVLSDGFAATSAEYLAAVAYFSQPVSPTLWALGRKLTGVDGTETWTQAATAILEENSDFYGVAINSRVQADQEEIAAWTEANDRLCGISSADADIKAATILDIAGVLQTAAYDRSYVFYHPDADGGVDDPWAEMAWMGNRFPSDPGSSTWKFKTLTGVPSYVLSSTERTNILGKNCAIYTNIGGVNITEEGKVASGEWIDIIRGIDWNTARITEAVFSLFVNTEKVPYTDPGVATVEAEIKKELQNAVTAGLYKADPAPVTTVPLVADVPAAAQLNRLLPDIKFTASLAGAIHALTINGVVSV